MNSRNRPSGRQNRRWREIVSLLLACLFILPLIWLALGSLQPTGQTSQVFALIPQLASISNYWRVFQSYDLAHPVLNSLLVVGAAIPLTLLTASGAGFAMSQLGDRVRRPLLVFTIILMIVPLPALWLPRFVMFAAVGWIDSLLALIIPALMGTSPFYVLLFYWSFRRIQANVLDAARLDGAGTFGLWWRIALPQARLVINVVIVLSFAFYWGDYMSALIYLRSEALYTLPLRLQLFMTQDIPNQPLAMAATLLAILPVLLLFLWIQRYLWPEGRS